MPEMRFSVRWPDGSEAQCWSPSLVIRDHLAEGMSYPVAEFARLAGLALGIASDRVRAKYGAACPRALAQRAEIEARAGRFQAAGDRVTVLAFRGC